MSSTWPDTNIGYKRLEESSDEEGEMETPTCEEKVEPNTPKGWPDTLVGYKGMNEDDESENEESENEESARGGSEEQETEDKKSGEDEIHETDDVIATPNVDAPASYWQLGFNSGFGHGKLPR